MGPPRMSGGAGVMRRTALRIPPSSSSARSGGDSPAARGRPEEPARDHRLEAVAVRVEQAHLQQIPGARVLASPELLDPPARVDEQSLLRHHVMDPLGRY